MNPQSREWSVAWQLQAERRDGPRYVEAIRGAREIRGDMVNGGPWRTAFSLSPTMRVTEDRAYVHERLRGIPEGWITR